MIDKASLINESYPGDNQNKKIYSAQTTSTWKDSCQQNNNNFKLSNQLTHNVNNLQQMQGDLNADRLATSVSEQGFLDPKLYHNLGVINALDISHKDGLTMIASSNKSSTFNNNHNSNFNNNNKASTPQQSQLLNLQNQQICENEKTNKIISSHSAQVNKDYWGRGEEQEIEFKNQQDASNSHNDNLKSQLTKADIKRDIIGQCNVETQGDEEGEEEENYDCDVDEEDTCSEFIKELLKNEQKLTQKIYCSQIKALKVTKIFNDLIFSMKAELLAYLTLEDICCFKKALQYYLGRSVTKVIDAQILKLIWTSEQRIDNYLLWDTLINYSFIRQQYPHQYEKQTQIVNAEHDKNIRMDLDRTFPEMEIFQNIQNQNKLFRVLNGLSYSIKEIGYIQGWNQITGLFLLYPEFSEDMVYWIMNHLMHKVSLKDLYLSIQNAYSTSPSESASEQQHLTPQQASSIQNNLANQYQSNNNHQSENRYKVSTNKYNFDDKENDFVGYNKREAAHQISCSTFEDKQSSNSSENNWANSAEPAPLIKLDFLTYAMKVYMKVYLNNVYRQIEKTNYTIYIQKWFTVLFSQQLSPEITLSLMAGIVLQDWNYLIKMALAVFDILKEEILFKSDPDDIMELFYDNFNFTKQQVYSSIQKFEITNEQLLQIMHLFEDQSDIDTIQLIDGRFYKVEQKQRREFVNSGSQSGSFFERVGKFFSSSSKQETIQYFEERSEVKYNSLPQGAKLDENKFSELIHFNRVYSKKLSKDYSISPSQQNPIGLHEHKPSLISQQSQNNQNSRPFLEQRADLCRYQANCQVPQNSNFKASPSFTIFTTASQAQQNLKSYSQNQSHTQFNQNYKPFHSSNQITTKEKEFDITLQFQSQ
ncbi:rab-GTPase-TBC domain protein (macronuclear) [Tetrahymena thermophila SB210]|uniref:Rab-GTPase-TBC domain protein n=1 Tax=Tetrahymena thermophila (strain SB210) TaxID=312017 RepID=Q22RL8_TETTS|nr:rab-GTPase-TBC domain protein [Tetrahymena thermophila SB210]EAR88104.2 rab-GTPase-TBC domain protein [Tetrahymena thermophila SB210]|eukprot:XP_001008349.2 rab-GTPase-TBC domain protein [Tetrahymena thermophila SB210]